MITQYGGETLDLGLLETSGIPTVRLVGAGSRTAADRLRDLMAQLGDSEKVDVIVDVRGLRFLDLGCAGVLSDARERLEEAGGTMVIVDQSPPVERALKLMGLEQLAVVVPTPEDAVRHLMR